MFQPIAAIVSFNPVGQIKPIYMQESQDKILIQVAIKITLQNLTI